MKMNGENLEGSGYDLVDKVNLGKIWKSLPRTKPQCFDPYQLFNYALIRHQKLPAVSNVFSHIPEGSGDSIL